MSKLLALLILCVAMTARAATPDELLRQGLFEEEANRDPAKAAAAYAEVIQQYDAQRKVSATALFRLAEIRAKAGDKPAAAALYQRFVAEFPDTDPLAKLSRERLGAAAAPDVPAPASAPDGPENRELSHVRELVKFSPDLLDALDKKDAYTPLMQAAERGWMLVAGALLDHGAKANGLTGAGEPLHLAAAGGHKGMVELLLAHGADLNAATPDGWTALHAACYNRRTETLALLLDKKANPNRAFEPQLQEHPGWGPVSKPIQGYAAEHTVLLWQESVIGTPLFIALKDHDHDLLTRLLDRGADPNLSAKARPDMLEKISPLMLALSQRQPAAAKTLLGRGAKADFVMGGVTALHAAAFGSPAYVPALLNAGLAQTADPLNGWTPLFYSMVYSPGTRNLRAPDGALIQETAAEFEARSAGSRVAWDALLAHGADINARDMEGASLLHRAMSGYWSTEMLGWLVAHGADLNARDKKGLTPLLTCCDVGGRLPELTNRLAWLLDHGAELEVVDATGGGAASHIRDTDIRLAIERQLFHPRRAAKLTRENAVNAFFSFKNSSGFAIRVPPVADYDAPPTLADLLREVVSQPGSRSVLNSLPLTDLTVRIFRAGPAGAAVEAVKLPLHFGAEAVDAAKWPALRWGDTLSIESDGAIGRPDWLAPATAALRRTVEAHVGERTATLAMADPSSRERQPSVRPVIAPPSVQPLTLQWSPTLSPLPDWTLSELVLRLAEAEPRADLSAIRLERIVDGKTQSWAIDLRATRPEDAEEGWDRVPSRVKKSAARLANGDRLTIPLQAVERAASRNGIWLAAPGRLFATEVFARSRCQLGVHTLGELLMQAYLGPMVVPHPDLAHLVIHRLKEDGEGEESIPVDLLNVILDPGVNPAQEGRRLDPPLQWGDTVEVAMIEGAEAATWKGFSNTTRAFLSGVLQRKVAVMGNEQKREPWGLSPDFSVYLYDAANRERNFPGFLVNRQFSDSPFTLRELLHEMAIEPDSLRCLTMHWGVKETMVFNSAQLKSIGTAIDPWIDLDTAVEFQQFSP